MSEAPCSYRPAAQGDLDRLRAIESAWPTAPGWSRAQFEQELGNERGLLLVAEILSGARRELAGYACFWRVADEGQILNIAVAPGLARRGLGRALLNELLERARAGGLSKVTLEVSVRNLPARRLYESSGFRVVGRRPKYYNDGSDALLMDKLL